MKKVNLRQTMILFFVIGLMTSCSKPKLVYDNPTVQQLVEIKNTIKNIDFDNVDGVREFVTSNRDEAEEWADEERANERIVYMSLNRETGEYIRKSIPKGNITFPAEDKLLDLLDKDGVFLLEDED